MFESQFLPIKASLQTRRDIVSIDNSFGSLCRKITALFHSLNNLVIHLRHKSIIASPLSDVTAVGIYQQFLERCQETQGTTFVEMLEPISQQVISNLLQQNCRATHDVNNLHLIYHRRFALFRWSYRFQSNSESDRHSYNSYFMVGLRTFKQAYCLRMIFLALLLYTRTRQEIPE